MHKPTVLLLGKLPPPFIGPAIATKNLLNSDLKNRYNLLHLNTSINSSVATFGKFSLLKPFKSLFLYLKQLNLMINSRPDVTLIPISQTTMGFLKDAIFVIIAAAFGKKILVQLRGSNFKNWIQNTSSLTKIIVKFTLRRTDGVLVLGNNLKHLFENYFPENKIFVVQNGGDFAFPSEETKEKVQLLYFANFLPSKGFDFLLKSLAKLNPGLYELNAAGAWDNEIYKQTCLKIIKDSNLNVTIHPPSSGNAKWQFFANSDIFLFTPIAPEGHPWVIIEAMAAGLPIISSNQGAIIESVIHGENGYIVDPTNSKQLGGLLEELIKHKSKRIEMGKKSLAHYQANFTEQMMIDKLCLAINTTLAK